MAELKTKKSDASVTTFLSRIEPLQRRDDGFALLQIFSDVTKMQPALWGGSIIGFGEYHYKSDRSRQEGDWPLTGFSPRKRNMTVYIMPGFSEYQDLLVQLGRHQVSKSCLYFARLDNVDITILKRIIRQSVAEMKKRYSWKK
ncbi:MAG: DUF1801 domain-containing protein [Pseudomonadota bacterium]